MTKLIRQASPHHQPRMEFQTSPEALLASYGAANAAVQPWLYVFNTATPSTAARLRKGYEHAVTGVQRARVSDERQLVAWIDALRALQSAQPTTPVLVVADDNKNTAWEAFLDAGADEVITPAALQSLAVVKRRIESAFAHARADSSRPTAVIEADDALTETQIANGLAKVRAAARARPRAGDRPGLVSDLLAITVLKLRAPSGRLDAQRIAQRLGLSLNAFAAGMPVSRETLRTNPDSKRIQNALDPYARALAVLDTLLPDDRSGQWLNTHHAHFGTTPLEAMVTGRADEVARLLELAREGAVD